MSKTIPGLSHFSVQTVGGAADGSTIHVEAQSPVQAAEIALGEILSVHGDAGQVRAIVWHLGDHFSPVSVRLYRRD